MKRTINGCMYKAMFDVLDGVFDRNGGNGGLVFLGGFQASFQDDIGNERARAVLDHDPLVTMAAILCQPSCWQSAAASVMRSACTISTMRSTRGEASNTSIVRARVSRPASGIQSLSGPCMRRLEPAATISAADIGCIGA